MPGDTEEMLFLSALLVDIKPLSVIRQLLSMSISPIVITDAGHLDGGYKIIYANKAFCRLTGYELAELVGRSPKIFQGPDSHLPTIQRLANDLKETGYFRGTSFNYKKDGSAYPLEWDISPVKDEHGTIRFFVSIQRDLSAMIDVASQVREVNEAARQFIHNIKATHESDGDIQQESASLLTKLKHNAKLYSPGVAEDESFFDFDCGSGVDTASIKKDALSATDYLEKECLTDSELQTITICLNQLEEDVALLSAFPDQAERFSEVEKTLREISDAIFFLVEFTDTALALQEVADCMQSSGTGIDNRMIIEFLHSLLNELEEWVKAVFINKDCVNVYEGADNIVSSAKQVSALLRQ